MALVAFGNQLLGQSGVQFPPANNKAVCRFTNDTGHAVLVRTFYGRWGVTAPSARMRAVIYSDNAGNPDQLLAQSAERVGIVAGWNAIAFDAVYGVPVGASVWFGVISDTQVDEFNCLGEGSIRYNANAYSAGPSQTFGAHLAAAATYPMFLEGDDGQPRFGRASTYLLETLGTYVANTTYGDRFALETADSVTVASITARSGPAESGVARAAIFADANGQPGVLLAQSAQAALLSASGWLHMNLPEPVTLAPGIYWLCVVLSASANTSIAPAGGRLRGSAAGQTAATAFVSPSTLQSGATDFSPNGLIIYASYSAAAARRPVVFVAT